MSLISQQSCRKFSLVLPFMLLLQFSFGQNSFNKADKWLKDNLNDLGGRAVLVLVKDGRIIYEKARNDLSRKQKMVIKFMAKRQGRNANEMLQDYSGISRTNIASCSKWLSAALVMTFVDEGKLDLNDSIGKFLPVFTDHQKGDIKIWQCLSHLTGINAGNLKNSREIINEGNTMDEVMKEIAVQPMEGKPGKVFHYGSVGLQIAAAVIEKISGRDFKTLFRERITGPCDMTNTDFGKARIPLAAGGALSTPEDYAHFLQMILQNGKYNGKQVLSEESVSKMQYNYANDAKVAYSPEEAGNWGYGFGEWVMDNSLLASPDGGEKKQADRGGAVTSPGLFGSFPWVDNERKYAGFLFVFNLKNKGRGEKYKELKSIIDSEIENY